MVIITPRFILLDDNKRERSYSTSGVRKAFPGAEILEFSHPLFFRKCIEVNRAPGRLFAEPKPTVVLTDGHMPMHMANKDMSELETKCFSEEQDELLELKISNAGGGPLDDAQGTKQVLASEGAVIGPYVTALVSDRVSSETAKTDPSTWTDQLSSPKPSALFIKGRFGDADVRNLGEHLNRLISLEPSE